MSTNDVPKFYIIEVLCDKLPSKNNQILMLPSLLAINELPLPEKVEYERFGDDLAIHFMVYPIDAGYECAVFFKAVKHG